MPFEEAVKKYSIHSSNINNGFIGYVRKGYTWDDIIVDRLTELPVNGITDVIQTSRGWAIFRKRDVKPALNLSYDEVEKRIVTMLRNKKTAPEMANLKALSNELKRLVQSVDLDREELMSVLNTAETDVRKGIVNNYSQEKLDKPILKAQGFSYTVRDLVTALNSMDSVDRMQVMSNPGAMVDFILDIRNQEVLFKEAVARGLKMDRREQGLYEKSLNTILIDNYLEDLAIKRLKVDQKEVEELYKTRKKYHPHIFTSIQKAETAYILEKKAQLKNAVLEDIKAESDLLIDQGIYETFLKKFE
jgi:parvulin-like peptidyl-prolyl isomerase